MLAHVGHHRGVGREVGVELENRVARRHALALVGGLLVLKGAQLGDLLLPCGTLVALDLIEQLLERELEVAAQGHGGVHCLAQLGAVDVDVDDLGMRGEGRDLAGGAVVETRAAGNDAVGLVHADGAGIMAVHALHAQEAGMVGGHAGDTHHRAAHGRVDLVGKGEQLVGRSGGDEAAAEVDEGTLGGVDDFGSLLDTHLFGGMHRVGGHDGGGDVLGQGRLNVLGHVDEHGAGTVGLGDAERLADGVGQLLDRLHEIVVLRDGQRDARDVDLLEGVGADKGVGHIARDGNERGGVEVGGGDAGHKVGGTGARGGNDDADLAGGAGITVGCVGSSLLMGGQDMVNLVLILEDGVVNVNDLASGITEDRLAALLNERADDDVRS